MTDMRIGIGWSLLPTVLLFGAALAYHRPAAAVPAFAEQTGRNCAACHVGGSGPELTPFGREFKLGGYTLRMHAAVPLSAMAIASWTHTKKDQVPPPEHLKRNDNLVLDQASLFVAGGIGDHLGGFAQLVTYDGVGRSWSWDNIDLRAVTNARLFGEDFSPGPDAQQQPDRAGSMEHAAGLGCAIHRHRCFTHARCRRTDRRSPRRDGDWAYWLRLDRAQILCRSWGLFEPVPRNARFRRHGPDGSRIASRHRAIWTDCIPDSISPAARWRRAGTSSRRRSFPAAIARAALLTDIPIGASTAPGRSRSAKATC